MNYYPGNYINSQIFNFKEKLKLKGAEISNPGAVYISPAVQMENYKFIGFLKIDEQNLEKSLSTGIKEIIEKASRVILPNKEEFVIDSVVFSLCEELCEPEKIIRMFFKALDSRTNTGLKEVYLTTKDPKYFAKCISVYNKMIIEMVDEN